MRNLIKKSWIDGKVNEIRMNEQIHAEIALDLKSAANMKESVDRGNYWMDIHVEDFETENCEIVIDQRIYPIKNYSHGYKSLVPSEATVAP